MGRLFAQAVDRADAGQTSGRISPTLSCAAIGDVFTLFREQNAQRIRADRVQAVDRRRIVGA